MAQILSLLLQDLQVIQDVQRSHSRSVPGRGGPRPVCPGAMRHGQSIPSNKTAGSSNPLPPPSLLLLQAGPCPSTICQAAFNQVDCCREKDYFPKFGTGAQCQWYGAPVSFWNQGTCEAMGKKFLLLKGSNSQGQGSDTLCRCKDPYVPAAAVTLPTAPVKVCSVVVCCSVGTSRGVAAASGGADAHAEPTPHHLNTRSLLWHGTPSAR